jgi:hypothetical protein
MLCNFFPINQSDSTNNGLIISTEEIIIIIWVTLFLIDEIREVNLLKLILNKFILFIL